MLEGWPELLGNPWFPTTAKTTPHERVAPVDPGGPLDTSQLPTGKQHDGGVKPLRALLLRLEPFEPSKDALGIGGPKFTPHPRLDPL